MATVSQETHSKGLGFAFFAGPVFWGVQLMVGYILANLAGLGYTKIWYYLLNAVVVILILAAGVVAIANWRRWSRREDASITDFEEPDSRKEFVATSGLFLSSIFFLLTLVTGIFTLFLSPVPLITMPFP